LSVEERPVPQAAVEGELLSRTQPFPLTPPLVPQAVAVDDAFGLTGIDKYVCRKAISSGVAGPIFTPPTEQGTLMSPFTGGGGNWGGTAFDPQRNLLIVNMSNLVHKISLIPAAGVEEAQRVFHDQEVSPQAGAPYGMKRETFLSPLGLPCNRPPWGIVAAVDLASGDIVWRRSLGTTEDLAPGPGLELGTPNFGGPVVTAGGLIFIAAAMDDYLRALDVETGEELWRGRLPAGGQATPMTYEWQGRQYVTIFAGGHARVGTRLGDRLVAFALPVQ
jgi:quinoprotein glucose dehydrogenase